jgi:predicted Zn-dependent protease
LSAKNIRGRFLLGVLFHVAIGLFGCAGNFAARRAGIPVLGECGLAPSFAQATQLKRWESFPIDVAVDLSSFPAEFRETYREGVARGAGLWAEATGGRIGSVRIHYDRQESPISISLSEIPLPDRAIGSTELNVMGSRILSATVSLTRSRFEGTAFLAQDVASTTAHEMGHALGIVDHSPHSEDKMWASGNFGLANEGRDPSHLITPRDANTLEEAYCRR